MFGKLRPYLAKVASPEFEGTATSEILVLRPVDECSQSYLAYCLLNEPYIRWIDTLTYGAKMPRVSPDEVACGFLPLPPLPEQRAIAAFLGPGDSRIDELVARKERLIELLQEKRTGPHHPRRNPGSRPQRADEGLRRRVAGGDSAHWTGLPLKRWVRPRLRTVPMRHLNFCPMG